LNPAYLGQLLRWSKNKLIKTMSCNKHLTVFQVSILLDSKTFVRAIVTPQYTENKQQNCLQIFSLRIPKWYKAILYIFVKLRIRLSKINENTTNLFIFICNTICQICHVMYFIFFKISLHWSLRTMEYDWPYI